MGIANLRNRKEEEKRISSAVRNYGLAKQNADATKRELDAAKEILLNVCSEFGLDEIETDEAIVLVSEIPGRQTWDGKKLEAFFEDNPAQLTEFQKLSKPSTRINFKPKILTS